MRVLWFTNNPSCYSVGTNPYNGGGWISSAERAFHNCDSLSLAVSFLLNNQPFKTQLGNIVYYPVPSPKSSLLNNVYKCFALFSSKSSISYEEKSWPYYLDYFKKIIDDYKPDVIHIWGSESHWGLVHKVSSVPIVLHIQGVLNPYLNAYLPPFVSWKSLGSGLLGKLRALYLKRRWQKNCHRERIICKGIINYLGRTDWDRRVSHIMNPNSIYFHVDEILRDSFYSTAKRVLPEKLIIVTTISNPLYKGFDLVLKTAKILKYDLKLNFEWKCFGNINPLFIEKTIGIYHQDVNVSICGVVSSDVLVETELNSTLYFHSSYIDNSPNSLCEAQMLGIPVISTNVGGIESLVENGVTGYLIPANDPYQGAFLIEMLFQNRDLNFSIGEKAKSIAMRRHSKEKIVNEIINVYNFVANQ